MYKIILCSLVLFSSLLSQKANTLYETIEDKNTLSISTPSVKKRMTKKIRLNNHLEAYIISDPNTNLSAAALSVDVGSWNDLENYPGIAHFTEHLLFLNSEKYPEENGLWKHVLDNGGSMNAYTAPDKTVYMFSINHDAFEEGLDRFGHFFIDPLFDKNGIDRELKAVDQEHSKNIEHDGWRMLMVLKETGNPNHPNSKFSTGNSSTLGEIPRDELINWYKTNYSADHMHLVVYSNKPLEELTQYVTTTFSDVPIVPTQYKYHEKLFSEAQEGQLIQIKPIRDSRTLSLMWEIPIHFVEDVESQCANLIAYTLNCGGDYSLFEQLKRESLAENLNIAFERIAKGAGFLSIDIDLTTKGLNSKEVVLERVFQALKQLSLRGIPTHVYNQYTKMQQLGYEYQSRTDPFTFVSKNADKMYLEPLETFPQKQVLPTIFKPKLIRTLLTQLTPYNCVYVLQDSFNTIEYDRQEKWLGAEYTIQPIPSETLKHLHEITIHPKISLPLPNHWVPNDLKLHYNGDSTYEGVPFPLAKTNKSQYLFFKDTYFQTPYAHLHLGIKSPVLDSSLKCRVITDLLTLGFIMQNTSQLSLAGDANLYFTLKKQDFLLNLTAYGYSEHTDSFLITLLEKLRSHTITKEQFNLYKESLAIDYKNKSKSLAIHQGLSLLNHLLSNSTPNSTLLLETLKNTSYEEYLQFSQDLWKEIYIESLMSGNIDDVKAKKTMVSIEEILKNSRAFEEEKHFKKEGLSLKDYKKPITIRHENSLQGNATILTLYAGEFSFESEAIQEILTTSLKESFFSTLRTKQQTGYIVQSWNNQIGNELYLFFAVQSSTHYPEELLARFDLFLEKYAAKIHKNIEKERFESIKKVLIFELEQPSQNLISRSKTLFNLAYKYEGDFQRKSKQIEALKNLSYESFIKSSSKILSRPNKSRIAMLVHGQPTDERSFSYEETTIEELRKS